MTQFNPKIGHLSDLLYAAEEQGQKISSLVWYLIGRDPLTAPLRTDLLVLAADAQIKVGSRHWSLSALVLNQQVDHLLAADGRTWKSSHDLLDPYREQGVDYVGLIATLDARIARFRGDGRRMRQIRRRLLSEVNKKSQVWATRSPAAE